MTSEPSRVRVTSSMRHPSSRLGLTLVVVEDSHEASSNGDPRPRLANWDANRFFGHNLLDVPRVVGDYDASVQIVGILILIADRVEHALAGTPVPRDHTEYLHVGYGITHNWPLGKPTRTRYHSSPKKS